MYLNHFGLKHSPLGKESPINEADEQFCRLKAGFNRLLSAPGIGVLTGESGVGKTAALRHLTLELNPHRYESYYLPETPFSNFDVYRQISQLFGLAPAHRFAQLWRDIKGHIKMQAENRGPLPILIIDEAQNLPVDFFKSFPSFMNFDFDAKDLLTVWLVGDSSLAGTLKRNGYTALASRIQFRLIWQPCFDQQKFKELLTSAFKNAGAQEKLISDSGIELIRLASGGRARLANRILNDSMDLAMQNNAHHLSDDCLQEAIQAINS